VKNSLPSIKNRISSKYSDKEMSFDTFKSTDVNILLNRVKLDKKRESRNKIFFSLVATFGFFVFGFLIF
tara:strand:- start:291 stop:497 length:207 start_codon:yes stop_codon:yes gene_type:complete